MSARSLRTAELKQLALKAGFKPRILAKLLHSSPRQMRRDFREQFGESPIGWLRGLRVGEARRLLECGERQKEVVHLLGFADSAHLSREFKTFYDVPSRALKRSAR
jgi:transcriptional regulator GlxA family with amidase domain